MPFPYDMLNPITMCDMPIFKVKLSDFVELNGGIECSKIRTLLSNPSASLSITSSKDFAIDPGEFIL